MPARAAACPHCGSDEETGWSEGAHDVEGWATDDESWDHDDEDDFDYDEYLRREFPEHAPPRQSIDLLRAARWALVLVLILLFTGWLTLGWSRVEGPESRGEGPEPSDQR